MSPNQESNRVKFMTTDDGIDPVAAHKFGKTDKGSEGNIEDLNKKIQDSAIKMVETIDNILNNSGKAKIGFFQAKKGKKEELQQGGNSNVLGDSKFQTNFTDTPLGDEQESLLPGHVDLNKRTDLQKRIPNNPVSDLIVDVSDIQSKIRDLFSFSKSGKKRNIDNDFGSNKIVQRATEEDSLSSGSQLLLNRLTQKFNMLSTMYDLGVVFKSAEDPLLKVSLQRILQNEVKSIQEDIVTEEKGDLLSELYSPSNAPLTRNDTLSFTSPVKEHDVVENDDNIASKRNSYKKTITTSADRDLSVVSVNKTNDNPFRRSNDEDSIDS